MAAASLLVGFSTFAETETLKLACEDQVTNWNERERIRLLASDVVVRRSRHEVDVRAAGLTLKFVDKPPYDEPLSGVTYRFCDRRDGFVLIHVDDDSTFTGKLVNEDTGDVSPAGLNVMFSSDRHAYLASEQPTGLDGQVLRVYAVSGRLSWSGFDFIESASNPGHIDALLHNLQWTSHGVLTAKASCWFDNKRTWSVSLVKTNGRWDWSPKRPCPDEPKP